MSVLKCSRITFLVGCLSRTPLMIVQNKINSVFCLIFREADTWSQIMCMPFDLFVSFSVAGERHCEDFSLNGHDQPQLPFGCYPATETLHGQHICGDSPENNNTAGSQVEHQKSVKAEQLYDHAFYSTMLLYHGS